MAKKSEEIADAPEAKGIELDEQASGWVERYMAMWRKAYALLPAGMKSEEAAAGAINGMMIGADRHGLLKALPITTPVPEKKTAEAVETPKAEPTKGPEPVMEAEPKKEPPTDAVPTKRQTALPEEDAPIGADGQPLLAYDRNKPGWNYCPLCKNKDITHHKNPPKSGTYQACWECRIWLPADKDRFKPMDQGERA